MSEHNHELRAAREATSSPRVPGACMSREELAEAVNAWMSVHTDSHGALDKTYVGRLEQGRVRWPGRDYRAAFRAVLGAGSDAQLGFRPSNRQPVQPLRRVHVVPEPNDPDGAERLSEAITCPRRTDRASIEAVAEVLASLRRLEDETSAAAVRPSVQAQYALVERLAAGARERARPVAVGLASEISQYLGWLAIPLGRYDEAHAHLDRAAMLALEADDPMRLSTALSFRAYASLRQGDYASADALSEAACRDPRVHIGLRTYETYQRAEVLARTNDQHAAARLLVEADDLVQELPPPEELPPSGYWYTPAFFLGQKGFVLRALGDTAGAREAARACLEAMPPEWAASEWAERRRALGED